MSNNPNQYQNSQNGYPQSQQSHTPSGYPQSGQQYPVSTYEDDGGFKSWHIAVIIIVAVIIVALATTLIVVMKNKPDPAAQNAQIMMPPQIPMTNATPGSVLINGQVVTFDVIEEEGKTYLPVEDFAKAINYTCSIDDSKVKLTGPMDTATLTVDSTSVEVEDTAAAKKVNVNITTAPFKKGDVIYIYARDITMFVKNSSVTYNAVMEVVEINAGMSPGMPPPPGGGYGYPPPPPPGYAQAPAQVQPAPAPAPAQGQTPPPPPSNGQTPPPPPVGK